VIDLLIGGSDGSRSYRTRSGTAGANDVTTDLAGGENRAVSGCSTVERRGGDARAESGCHCPPTASARAPAARFRYWSIGSTLTT
jgi:hypothetical protein